MAAFIRTRAILMLTALCAFCSLDAAVQNFDSRSSFSQLTLNAGSANADANATVESATIAGADAGGPPVQDYGEMQVSIFFYPALTDLPPAPIPSP